MDHSEKPAEFLDAIEATSDGPSERQLAEEAKANAAFMAAFGGGMKQPAAADA